MTIAYQHAPENTDAVLRLIAKAATGRKLLEDFLPLLARARVTIEAYPAEITRQLRAVLPADQPIGACFSVDPNTNRGTIHLDFTSPIGVLAPFLVHEIVHALDPRIWRGETQRTRQVLYATETEAFQQQFRFTQELRERDPAYDTFLRATYPKAKILNELLEPEDVEALYGDVA